MTVVNADEVLAEHMPQLPDHQRALVRKLVQVVLDALPDAQWVRKWGQLTFTRDENWNHWIGAVSTAGRGPKLVIHKGALLADPAGLMTGDGRYSRTIAPVSAADVDTSAVRAILDEAARRQTEMLTDEDTR